MDDGAPSRISSEIFVHPDKSIQEAFEDEKSKEFSAAEWGQLYGGLWNLALYLGSSLPDVEPAKMYHLSRNKREISSNENNLHIYRVGFRIGAKVNGSSPQAQRRRENLQAEAARQEQPRPVRAHWQRYWIGPTHAEWQTAMPVEGNDLRTIWRFKAPYFQGKNNLTVFPTVTYPTAEALQEEQTKRRSSFDER
jgi:hypothetical protein